MTTTILTSKPGAPGITLGANVAGIVGQLALWRAYVTQRRQLLTMDQRALKDLGISRYEALAEGTKPWWKA